MEADQELGARQEDRHSLEVERAHLDAFSDSIPDRAQRL
jgi:hypothetical protein